MMKRITAVILLTAIISALFSGCSMQTETTGETNDMTTAATAHTKNTVNTEKIDDTENAHQTSELTPVPEEYYDPAEKQGTLTELYYDTYEATTYHKKTQVLTKRAIVYLPYNYDENTKYNVFYLMHGGWSNETTQLGTPDDPSRLKNIIDHAIADGKIEPIIVVCPTYNNTSPKDSANYSLAFYTLTVNYHNELVNDLIPAVEGKYSTYAAGTSPEDIIASRDHRAFGGFSMGSVTTWHIFINCLDQFRYFMPMSGAMDYDGIKVDSAVSESAHSPDDFYIFAATGTEDFEYRNFTNQMDAMFAKESGNFRQGENVEFHVKDGYAHDGLAATEYTYNGMLRFWGKGETKMHFDADTKIADVISDPAFGDYGRLIFPVNKSYYHGDTLGQLYLTWYNYTDPDKTVEIVNYMKDNADTVFYDIYTDEEKALDPTKADTGLFFFKGKPGEKFAICNAGGGFSYVGAMHDSFPHALELSKKGYNAFALIYRPGVWAACMDLARAISFVFENAEMLEVDTDCYSLWGGSAGGRMAAYLGSYGPAEFEGDDLPRAGTVVMQYTGHRECMKTDPPTFACVGTADGIANWRTMKARMDAMSAAGIPTEFHSYEGLPHGFGLGTGTIAEGWLDKAVAFWENQMN